MGTAASGVAGPSEEGASPEHHELLPQSPRVGSRQERPRYRVEGAVRASLCSPKAGPPRHAAGSRAGKCFAFLPGPSFSSLLWATCFQSVGQPPPGTLRNAAAAKVLAGDRVGWELGNLILGTGGGGRKGWGATDVAAAAATGVLSPHWPAFLVLSLGRNGWPRARGISRRRVPRSWEQTSLLGWRQLTRPGLWPPGLPRDWCWDSPAVALPGFLVGGLQPTCHCPALSDPW